MNILGALIISGGALFGIWLGAVYAAGRLEAQLDEQRRWFDQRHLADAQRLDQMLEAESERLERQLQHDRTMRDRDELRRVLDGVGEKIMGAIQAALDFQAPIPALGNSEELREETAAQTRTRNELRNAARQTRYELTFEIQRLRLRFGGEHEVVEAFGQVHSTLGTFIDACDVEKDKWNKDQREIVEDAWAEIREANSRFFESCRRYTGVD
ncbi:MAG TPA: hypothetical protein VFU16_10825 [Solirubrobacterales bacterium]|nr:hypothetical protein [Solirubrobacterales bacterium]